MALTIPISEPASLDRALALLRAGEPIAFPTDTVYGVGAAALNAAAVARLYTVKRRPLTQAIPLLIADEADLPHVAEEVTPTARRLARLWPGALTLVLMAAPGLPSELLAGGATVAVRLPDHTWLRALMRALGMPLAATSANLHGGRDPRTAADVAAQLGDALSLIVDGGPTPGPLPSTIVDCAGDEPRLLRAGALPWERVVAELQRG
ncbi:MAG TPA: L-threonylcarbamoyladenylate synthase [Roseiflexaceae bacterium]